jgi:hypothetical protein
VLLGVAGHEKPRKTVKSSACRAWSRASSRSALWRAGRRVGRRFPGGAYRPWPGPPRQDCRRGATWGRFPGCPHPGLWEPIATCVPGAGYADVGASWRARPGRFGGQDARAEPVVAYTSAITGNLPRSSFVQNGGAGDRLQPSAVIEIPWIEFSNTTRSEARRCATVGDLDGLYGVAANYSASGPTLGP